jgi:hypothetical protein
LRFSWALFLACKLFDTLLIDHARHSSSQQACRWTCSSCLSVDLSFQHHASLEKAIMHAERQPASRQWSHCHALTAVRNCARLLICMHDDFHIQSHMALNRLSHRYYDKPILPPTHLRAALWSPDAACSPAWGLPAAPSVPPSPLPPPLPTRHRSSAGPMLKLAAN